MAEAAVPEVEVPGHPVEHLVEEPRGELPARAGDPLAHAGERLADLLSALRHLRPLRPVELGDTFQHASEAGASVAVLRREIGPAEKDFAVRGEEGGERPAALPRDRLHRPLVAAVHVGPLVPVHLDGDEEPVDDLGGLRILVGLLIHHVTPVAPHRPAVEQDRLVLGLRPLERCLPPRPPVDGLVRRGSQVGAPLGRQPVLGVGGARHRYPGLNRRRGPRDRRPRAHTRRTSVSSPRTPGARAG